MSPRPAEDDDREDDDVDVTPAADMPDRADGATEFDTRTTWRVLFNDPAVRNYTIAALGSLAMIFLVLFQQGSDVGGLLVVLVGVCGVMLRFPAAPAFVLVLITYFMIFPFGVPGLSYENRFEIDDGRFRFQDVLMAMAVLVYVASQYRLYGLVSQAIAFEGSVKRHDEPATRRPAALIAPSELGVLLALSAVLVVAGQLVWWVVTSVETTPTGDFPLRWAGEGRSTRRFEPPGSLPPGATRFVVLAGLLFFGLLLGRLVFGYWRLRVMGAAEGGMVLLDGGWLETKRERSRVEKWRIWGRRRAEARAKAAEEQQRAEEVRARRAAARAATGGKR